MIRDPVYREAVKHRQAAVEDSRLIRHAVLPVGKTFGEIDRERKATVSHRGKALKKFAEALPSLLDFAMSP